MPLKPSRSPSMKQQRALFHRSTRTALRRHRVDMRLPVPRTSWRSLPTTSQRRREWTPSSLASRSPMRSPVATLGSVRAHGPRPWLCFLVESTGTLNGLSSVAETMDAHHRPRRRLTFVGVNVAVAATTVPGRLSGNPTSEC